MAHVQKRVRQSGATTYLARWTTPDGKERTKGGFRTRKAAQAHATRAENGKLTGREYDPKAGGVTFREAATEWLDSRHDLKPSTRDGYRYALAPAAERRGHGKTLGIDAVFGGYPLNAITRDGISSWVRQMVEAGKKPSTVRHAYFVVRMVLGQAVADGRLPTNPADYVKLPTEHSASGNTPGVVDDPAQFLTAEQVDALVAATPWPYNVYVHVAAWAGPRAAELTGLQVGDVDLPAMRNRPGALCIERTTRVIGGELTQLTPKTRGSRRRVPLTVETTDLLRDYLAEHPRADEPTAPLFPAMTLTAQKPTGKPATDATCQPDSRDRKRVADRQAAALAALTVAEAEARLVLDWSEPLRHPTFYKAVYRPAVLRANRVDRHAGLSAALKFHSLRHTYVSLCVAAGIEPLKISRFVGHAKVTTTLGIYTHLFNTDDHAGDMDALSGLVRRRRAAANNVLPFAR